MKDDVLKIMTKEELIYFIKTKIFRIDIRESEVLFYRWQIQSDQLLKEELLNNEYLRTIDSAARDQLARQFNNETDINKKLQLIKKIYVYDKQFQKWYSKNKVLQTQQKELDKLLDRSKTLREQEK
jgi:hypothetical protein